MLDHIQGPDDKLIKNPLMCPPVEFRGSVEGSYYYYY